MFRKSAMSILPTLVFVIVFVFAGQSAQADWGISIRGAVRTPGYAYYGDRLTTDYRRGYQVDDWVERGTSSVTESPVFADGIRLAAWGTRYDDDFEFALASAIYFFEIPRTARSIRVKVYYDGEADRDDLNGGIAGRVWIRRSDFGDDYGEFYTQEGRYEDVDEPLFGDTFVLRARKHFEILRLSADDHVVDDMMELHVVAEGRQRIDVKYIEVETYSYRPSIRVVTRYYRDYVWQPWYDYTYLYFYAGPVYHFSDHYYVRYIYPRYRYNYVTVRKRYNNYLRVYYGKYPRRRVRWVNVIRVPAGARRTWDPDRLNKWTRKHEEARKSYRVVSMKKRRPDEVRETRTRVRDVLTSSSRLSPATVRSRSGNTSAAPSIQRRTSTATRSSSVTDVKRRRESSDALRDRQQRANSSTIIRGRTDASQSPRRTPTEVQTRIKRRSDDARSSIRERSSSSSQRESGRSVRSGSSRSSRESQTEVKKRREVTTRSRTSESSKRQAPSRQTRSEKDDDDEDDDDKKKSGGSISSSSSKKRVRKTR